MPTVKVCSSFLAGSGEGLVRIPRRGCSGSGLLPARTAEKGEEIKKERQRRRKKKEGGREERGEKKGGEKKGGAFHPLFLFFEDKKFKVEGKVRLAVPNASWAELSRFGRW